MLALLALQAPARLLLLPPVQLFLLALLLPSLPQLLRLCAMRMLRGPLRLGRLLRAGAGAAELRPELRRLLLRTRARLAPTLLVPALVRVCESQYWTWHLKALSS